MTDTGHSYTLFSRQTVLPGLMTIRDAGGSMDFRLSDRFNLTVGSYALKYQSNFGNVYNDGVAFMSAGYELLPWLTVGAYGQYSIFSGYNAQNGSLLLSPLVPATSFGTYGIVMFNEYIGVQGWAGKEFNPFTGKWKPVYGAAPVINFNALFK